MKCLRVFSAALVALAAIVALALMLVAGFSLPGPQQASAQGTVNFDIDPDITGNSADTLGAVEDCVRLDGSGGFDGVPDVTIDVVVYGDTQAPVSYDASVIYEPAKVDPVGWDGLIASASLPPLRSINIRLQGPHLAATIISTREQSRILWIIYKTSDTVLIFQVSRYQGWG